MADVREWEEEIDQEQSELIDSQSEERIIRLPSENDLMEANETLDFTTHDGIKSESRSNLLSVSETSFNKLGSDCMNFSQRSRELAYIKHSDIFGNWRYSEEERAFLRHRIETFSREQCIIHCILGHMLMTPEEMSGIRQDVPGSEEARQSLLSLVVGSHWDVYNMSILMAFSEKLNVLLRLSGDGLYRNVLDEPRAVIEGHVKVHVLNDTATPFLLYSNL